MYFYFLNNIYMCVLSFFIFKSNIHVFLSRLLLDNIFLLSKTFVDNIFFYIKNFFDNTIHSFESVAILRSNFRQSWYW